MRRPPGGLKPQLLASPQANDVESLPETLLGTMRLEHLDLSAGGPSAGGPPCGTNWHLAAGIPLCCILARILARLLAYGNGCCMHKRNLAPPTALQPTVMAEAPAPTAAIDAAPKTPSSAIAAPWLDTDNNCIVPKGREAPACAVRPPSTPAKGGWLRRVRVLILMAESHRSPW